MILRTIVLAVAIAFTVNVAKATPIKRASKYIGFGERSHTYELKRILGVNPRRVAWCGYFVSHVLKLKKPIGRARDFLRIGRKVKLPKRGDIMIFSRGRSRWAGHVGFYMGTTYIKGRKFYKILGGNQNNYVNIIEYPASRLLGIRRYKTA